MFFWGFVWYLRCENLYISFRIHASLIIHSRQCSWHWCSLIRWLQGGATVSLDISHLKIEIICCTCMCDHRWQYEPLYDTDGAYAVAVYLSLSLSLSLLSPSLPASLSLSPHLHGRISWNLFLGRLTVILAAWNWDWSTLWSSFSCYGNHIKLRIKMYIYNVVLNFNCWLGI